MEGVLSNPSKKRCNLCNSTQVYIRRITKELVCHSCGHVEKITDDIWRTMNG